MLLSLLGSIGDSNGLKLVIIELLLSLPVLLFSLSVHESAHGFIANKCGDPTAKNLGRITLNPLKHFDLIGSIMMFVFGFGWAKPVPINSRYFKKPKRDIALTAAAGPISNLIVGLISVILDAVVQLTLLRNVDYVSFTESGNVVGKVGLLLSYLFYISAFMNTSLALFNLIPLPPFDGSRIAYVFLPDKIYWGVMKYERIILIVVLGLSFVLSRLGISFGGLASRVVNMEYSLLNLIVGLFN